MRTDAKIGFAIGGVLLAVLAVYLIVVPKHSNKKTVALVPSVGTPANAVVRPTPVVPTPASPITPIDSLSDSGPAAPVPPAVVTPPPVAFEDRTKPPVVDTHTSIPDDTFHKRSSIKTADVTDVTGDSPFVHSEPKSLQGDAVPPVATATRVKQNGRRGTSSHDGMSADRATHADHTTVAVTARQYTVKSGQTLSGIAADVYGNSRFWTAIQRENVGLDAKHLKVGQKINLPEIADTLPGKTDVEVVETVSTTGGTEVEPTAHTYRVQNGDSLYKISKKVFGTGRRSSAIYALNRDLIGDDESRLKLGMLLKLPEGSARTVASLIP